MMYCKNTLVVSSSAESSEMPSCQVSGAADKYGTVAIRHGMHRIAATSIAEVSKKVHTKSKAV
jgi:hypothetical protein